nr:hypothetical protein [Tanacetum cinerariifolium]
MKLLLVVVEKEMLFFDNRTNLTPVVNVTMHVHDLSLRKMILDVNFFMERGTSPSTNQFSGTFIDSNIHVEPSPYTTNPLTVIPGLSGVVQLSSNTRVEPSTSTQNPVRIIPCPAGLAQQARLLKEKVFILDPDGALMSTQQYMEKVVEDVGDDDDFVSAAWVNATNYVNAFGGTVTGCLGDVDNFLKKGKLEQILGIVKSCSLNMLGDLNVTLKDLSVRVGDLRTLKLDLKSVDNGYRSPFVKISAHVYGTDIITVDQGRCEKWGMKLTKEVANPRCLSYNIRNPAVFNLNTRMRQRVLAFGGPRQEVVTQYPEVDRHLAGQPAQSKLLLSVNWSPARVTIKHLCPLKNLGSIHRLRQEYARDGGGGGGGEVFGGGGFGGSVVFSGDSVGNGVRSVVCGVACGVFYGVVKASISMMIVRVPEKDRWCGTWGDQDVEAKGNDY